MTLQYRMASFVSRGSCLVHSHMGPVSSDGRAMALPMHHLSDQQFKTWLGLIVYWMENLQKRVIPDVSVHVSY